MAAAAAGDNDSAGETLDTQLLGTDLKIVRGMIVREGRSLIGQIGRLQLVEEEVVAPYSSDQVFKMVKIVRKEDNFCGPCTHFCLIASFLPLIDAVPQNMSKKHDL